MTKLFIKTMLTTCVLFLFAGMMPSSANDNSAVSQQNITITGVVMEKGDPVPGVSVVIKGTLTGTATGADGKFSIVVPNANTVLVFSYVGYLTQEITVGSQRQITVELQEDATQLEEVVVIGYGTRSKRDVTTAISVIDSKAIDKTISMSAQHAMQGTMSGVQVSGNTGNPMARPTIRIRGTNTWGVSDPLYVIDGIAITEMGAGIEGQEDARIRDIRGPINIMTMIDPNDIESISVLKDASAAAIYGVRAANGVILITTKKGRKEKPTVDLSVRYGVQNITQTLDWLTTPQYTKFVQGVYATDPTLLPAPENVGLFDPSSPKYLGNSPTYSWQDAVRNKNAPTQDYSVKVSGGTDNMDYYVSLGYSVTDGTLLNNTLKRYSGAIKINTKINDWIKFGINYRLVSSAGINSSGDYFSASRTPPWQPIYATGDIPGYEGYAIMVEGYKPDGTFSSTKRWGVGSRSNVLGIAALNDNKHSSLRNMGNIYLELTPVKGLTLKGTLSLDTYDILHVEFRDYMCMLFDGSGDPKSRGGGKSMGLYMERPSNNFNLTKEFMANYNTSIGNHNIDFLYNFSNQNYHAKYEVVETDYTTTKQRHLLNLGGEREYTSAYSDQFRWALQGHLFRIGYNYDYKYYLDATVRRDGSARFAPENRWGTFPSFSAAWRITKEGFLSGIPWLNDLKIRGGWGQLGNQEVRDMAYLSAISTNPSYAFGTVNANNVPGAGSFYTGATIFGMANKDLTWEKNETTNIGFDSQLFKGLSFSAEYYYKMTHGILQTMDLPPSVGFIDAPVANVAKVMNRGFEFSANYNGKVGELGFNVGGNLTTVINRVIETYKHIPTSGGNVEEGYSMFYHKAYKVAGIFQTDAEAKAWMDKFTDDSYNKSKVGAGDFYFQDLRGAPSKEGEFYTEGADGKINSYDQVYIGKSIPGFFYGFNLGVDYKGFDFSAQFSGVGDVIKRNSIKASTFYPTEGDNMTTIVYKAWTPENKQNVYPRLMFKDPAGNLRGSDFFYESAAYCRLQNIQLGYTLPATFYKSTNGNIRNVRVYVGASNLLTMTKWTGYDPENDVYPVARTIIVGLTARF